MELEYRHDFAEDEAKQRMVALGDYFANRHRMQVQWVADNRATVTGKYALLSIAGELELAGPGLVKLRGPDPGFLLRKKAEEYLRKKLDIYLNRATPIDALDRGK